MTTTEIAEAAIVHKKYTTASADTIIIIAIVITAIRRRIQKIQNEKIKSRTHNKRLFLYHLFYFIFMPIEIRGY